MARSRRGFLKGAAAGAVVAPPHAATAQESAPRNATAQANATTVAADTGRRPATVASRIVEKPGSDFMVDVLKTLDFEYLAANPGSTFQGLHESLITRCHEESAVAMAHGYAKIEGKPMIAMMHGTIGMQRGHGRHLRVPQDAAGFGTLREKHSVAESDSYCPLSS